MAVDLAVSLSNALVAVDRIKAERTIRDALAKSPPEVVAETVISAALLHIGDTWEKGDLALSQVFMASRIAEDLVDQLFPPAASVNPEAPTAAIAVLEDYHMLGRRMVLAALRASGLPALDYGRSTVEELVEKVRADGVGVLMISVLMLRSALRVKDLRNALEAEGLDIRIIVGGAPFRFDDELWREVGADAVGLSAGDAVRLMTNGGEAAA